MVPRSTQGVPGMGIEVTMKSFANLSNMKILSVFSVFLVGCATGPVEPPTMPSDPAARLAALMTGIYRHADTAVPVRDQRVALHSMGPGEWIYYQVNQGPDLKQVYRQRVLSLRSQADGRVIQTAYTLTAPTSFQAMGDKLSTLTLDQLQPETDRGCDMIWIEMPGGWSGQVDPSRCLIVSPADQAELRMGARADLNSQRLRRAETGYDLNGNRLWGSEDGEWMVLHRTP